MAQGPHVPLGKFAEEAEHKTSAGGGYCLGLHGAFRAWTAPAWRPGRSLEGPLLAHYLLFLSKPVRGTLTQNLAGGQFSREGKKGVNRTMAQIVWKKQRENPSGAPCGLDHCDGVNAFYIVLVYIHP